MPTIQEMIEQAKAIPSDVKDSIHYYNEMIDASKKASNILKSCGIEGNDGYYHPLLHCVLAQKGEGSRRNSKIIGVGKEIFDYIYKTQFENKNPISAIIDSIKDLTNNEYGCKIGAENPDKDCRDLLEDKRTQRMIDAGIR